MMTGKLFIDNVDAYAVYGLYVVNGGYNELIAYPPLKEPECNDWHEEDGIETDLSDVHLDGKELTIKFAFVSSQWLPSDIGSLQARYNSLMSVLSSSVYHTFNFAGIGLTFRLRFVSMPAFETYQTLGFLNIRFADDFPLLNYTYLSPYSTMLSRNPEFKLDNRPLSDYGLYVLQGSLADITKKADVKKNLTRNINYVSGVQYDGNGTVRYSSKKVQIKCLMRAATLTELWRNYFALLYDLSRPESRYLYCAVTGYSYSCFYSNCHVESFFASGKIWLSFNLTLTFCNTTPIFVGSPYQMRLVSSHQIRLTSAGNIRMSRK